MQLEIKKTDDFVITGSGGHSFWNLTSWVPLAIVGDNNSPFISQFKALYSSKGIYFLFECEDNRLTCRKTSDFEDIYNDDVVEVFLWTDETQDIYFEYELSPLDVELPIIVPNNKGS